MDPFLDVCEDYAYEDYFSEDEEISTLAIEELATDFTESTVDYSITTYDASGTLYDGSIDTGFEDMFLTEHSEDTYDYPFVLTYDL